MATVEFAFMRPVGSAGIDEAKPQTVEVETSSASNAATTAGATAAGDACVVTVTGGNVYVSFGSAPNAGTDANRRLVVDGTSRAFGGLSAGDLGACIDA